jgi:hypothetical protein
MLMATLINFNLTFKIIFLLTKNNSIMRKSLRILSLGLVLSLMFASFGFAQRVLVTPTPKKADGVKLMAVESTIATPFNQAKEDEGEWIHWDDGTNYTGIGYNGPGEFAVASRWEAADLADYDGLYITQISFFPREENATYSLKIWTGVNHSSAYTQDVEEVTIMEWNTVELETPYQIDASAEMMFGYYIITEAGYPAGADAGPAVGGKGDMLYDVDDGWVAMAADYGLNYNWNIQAYVMEMAGPDVYNVTFNVDMTEVEGFDPAEDVVYLTGSMVGWAEPGTEGSIEMELITGSKNAPFNFEDSFEDFDDFTTDLTPWTTYQLSEGETYGASDFDFPGEGEAFAFMVFNPSETDPSIVDNHPAQDGAKYVVAVQYTSTNDNKWIITPELSFNETSELSFWGKSITDAYGLERIKVLVSTTGTEPEDFTLISAGDYLEVPTSWTEYTFDLSDYAGETGYIAINYVSYDAFFFMLDNFKVTAEVEPPAELIYTATLELEAGTYEYKYFSDAIGAGWDGGEWVGDPNRVVTVVDADVVVNDIFGDTGLSTEALITDFGFDEGQDNVVIDGFTIMVHVAVGTDITELTPTMTISDGATIDYVHPTVMDFTDAQEFVVTAEDGETTNTYTVYVRFTSVEENVLSNLKVYPNPFSDNIIVSNAEGVNRVIITNLIGQVVMDMPLNSDKINTSNLSKGVYIVIFQGNNGERVVRKMVKN